MDELIQFFCGTGIYFCSLSTDLSKRQELQAMEGGLVYLSLYVPRERSKVFSLSMGVGELQALTLSVGISTVVVFFGNLTG